MASWQSPGFGNDGAGPTYRSSFGGTYARRIAQDIASRRMRLMDPEYLDAMGKDSVEAEIVGEILDSFLMESEVPDFR